MNERPGPQESERFGASFNRFQDRIVRGIAEANREDREIDAGTARLIADALGRAIGRESSLTAFGRTGEASMEDLRAEFQPIYEDESTPISVMQWIAWFGTYLTKRDGLPQFDFLAAPEPIDLDEGLVESTVFVGGKSFAAFVPGEYTGAQMAALEARLAEHGLDHWPALQAYLSLPDIDAMAADMYANFKEAFFGTYETREEALRALSPLEEWESDLIGWAIDHGIDSHAVQIDHRPLFEQLELAYDLVERNGQIHAFAK